MPDMPRPRPPHLQREVSRHGKVVWTVRVRRGPRVRIRDEYGTDAFWDAYRAALSGAPGPAPAKPGKGSLAWLIAQYRESATWLELAAATRRQRENLFKHINASAGNEAAARITAKTVKAGLERRKRTPSQARNFLDAMRGLYEWAVEAEHVPVDPTVGVRAPGRPKTKGFLKWTEDDEAAYERRWPLGTRQRVWLDVLRYTGLRRGDAVIIGWQHVRNGVIRLMTEKSGETIIVPIPILPPLAESLAAGPTADLAFICGENGQPLVKESFGNMFSEAARQAGVRKSAHGVRKLTATTAAENGATEAELDSLFGWKRGSGTSAIYTRDADRVRLAEASARKLLRTSAEQKTPSPSQKVRAAGRKVKQK